MMKRIKVSLMGVWVMIALAGCGSGGAAAVAEAPAETAEENVAEEIPAEETISDSKAKASEPDSDKITVGIVSINPKESPYRTANDENLRMAFTEENGYHASFAYGTKNEEQITAAQKFVQDGVDYLLLAAVDPTGWDSVLMDAKEAGVRVILFDRTITTDKNLYETSIVSDVEKEGEDAVAWLESQNLDACNIIHLQGIMGSAAQEGRTGALNAKVESHPDWTFVAQKTAGWNADDAKRIVQSVIEAGEPFNVIYAENDDMAKGAVAALDEADISHGVGGHVIIMGFECNKWALEELLAQSWNYDGQCNPFQSSYINEAIRTIESGGTVEKVIIMNEESFDATTITAEDIEDYGI